jgi:tRNA (adenine37-N6)-methyltransferase
MNDPQHPPVELRAIGVIYTPHRDASGTPIQPAYAAGTRGTVTLNAAYRDALADLEGFERIWLIYHFDRARVWQVRVVPFLDTTPRGLFATRAPARPNPLGMSVVRLVSVEGTVVTFDGADMLDGTPLLDIKPYVPEFDAHPGSRAGWFDTKANGQTTADRRFS